MSSMNHPFQLIFSNKNIVKLKQMDDFENWKGLYFHPMSGGIKGFVISSKGNNCYDKLRFAFHQSKLPVLDYVVVNQGNPKQCLFLVNTEREPCDAYRLLEKTLRAYATRE